MNKEAVRAQAAMYVTRLHSGEITAGEEWRINEWLQTPEHQAEFDAMLATWDLTEQLYQSPKPAIKPRFNWHWLGAGLAVAASALLAWVWVLPQISPHAHQSTWPVASEQRVDPAPVIHPITFDHFRITEIELASQEETLAFLSDIGEVRHINLTDGSVISLNTNTKLQVTFTDNERLVELIRGEAFFDVAHDVERPFIINTGEQRIRVLGTQFNVRMREDEAILQVSVVQGRVSVQPQRAQAVTAIGEPTNPVPAEENLLNAGDIGAFGPENKIVSQNELQYVSATQSWRHGVFRFENESLEQVVNELNRYRNQRIQIIDAEANALRISGVFHLKNGENILLALESSLPIRIERENDNVFVHIR
ncbi:FecR family protein [Aliidiomarina sp.]|uniref:FecR family protein n=1 Tax=Aliidiomarina sp. TaxID=1872439 RepID=UPI003A4D9DB2